MSSNLPLVHRSRRVLQWSGGLKLEINIPSQRIRAKWKGGLINEGGVISSEYGKSFLEPIHYGGGSISRHHTWKCHIKAFWNPFIMVVGLLAGIISGNVILKAFWNLRATYENSSFS